MKKKGNIRRYHLILTCLALSILSWFAVRISKSYTQTYHFEIGFVNLPNGKSVAYQSDTVVVVEVNGKGMFLLSLELKSKHLLLDYQAVTTPSQRKSLSANIQSKTLRRFFVENMNFPKNTSVIEPKRIAVELK